MYNSTKVTLLSVHAYTCILIGVGEGGMSPISPQDYNSVCVNLPPSPHRNNCTLLSHYMSFVALRVAS